MARRSRTRRPRRLPERLHIGAFDDRIQLFRRRIPREIPAAARELCEVGTADLGGICPLCTSTLASAPDGRVGSAEHVPPHAVGGVVRTRTCPECNGWPRPARRTGPLMGAGVSASLCHPRPARIPQRR